jgi:hypothetical protein
MRAKKTSKTRSMTVYSMACLAALIAAGMEDQIVQAKNLFAIFSTRHEIKETQSAVETKKEKNKSEKPDFISCKILIKAPVDTVWKTVHVERDSAPDLVSNKVLASSDNHATFEQKWNVIPFISRTSCVIDETEYPQTRIDYKLLKSDEFKVMQGSWLFSQAEDGNATLLELTAHLETRRINPKLFINRVAKIKMARRLAHIKKMAEENSTELKVKAKVL